MSDIVRVLPDGFHYFEYNPDRRKGHIIRKNADGTYCVLRKEDRAKVAGDFLLEEEAERWFFDDNGPVEFSFACLRNSVQVVPGATLKDIADAIDKDDFLSVMSPHLFPYLGMVGMNEGTTEKMTVAMRGDIQAGQLVLTPFGMTLDGNPVVEVSDQMFMYANGTRYMGNFYWSVLDLLLALFGQEPETLYPCTVTKDGIFGHDGEELSVLEALPRFCEVAEGTTLLDIFRIVDKDEIAKIFFAGYSWCKDIEAFHEHAERVVKKSHAEFLYNEVYASMDFVLKSHKDDVKPFDFSIGHDFHVIGKISDEERAEHPDWHEGRETQNYGVAMTHIGHYAWLPLKLDTGIKLQVYRTDLREEQNVLEFSRGITLLEMLDAVYMEISFHGGPESAEEFAAEMQERMDEIKSGEAKTIPMDEAMKDAEEHYRVNFPTEDEEGKRVYRDFDDLQREWEEQDKIDRPTEEEGCDT